MLKMGLLPVPEGWVSQKFSSSHKGIDIGWCDVENCIVRAWNDGYIIARGLDAAGAWYCVIKHDNGQISGYWHLKDMPVVSVGQKVSKGEKIGIRGKSGKATGTHLHFLLTSDYNPGGYNYADMIAHTIDPLPWLFRNASDGPLKDYLSNLPLEAAEIDAEALKKVINDNIRSMTEKIFDQLGYKVKNYKITYSVKAK